MGPDRYTQGMTVTTIKVSTELRDRISREAGDRRLTAAGFIAQLLDEHDRAERFTAFGRAFERADESYAAEVATWDSTSSDGLRP